MASADRDDKENQWDLWTDRLNLSKLKKLKNLKHLWVDNERANVSLIPRGEKRDDGTEKVFEEIIAENLPNLARDKSTDPRS